MFATTYIIVENILPTLWTWQSPNSLAHSSVNDSRTQHRHSLTELVLAGVTWNRQDIANTVNKSL